ncbi:hypothetical protein L6452_01993 [Arctium lappa]|uniref:Uncharacterized protein n=1 Tax=Arctium lappa TaxID=4217 RepID=A0ACB9FJG5_ARCLA|nr:hypothetical protein L6452_01993 [Arctium lappa]
MFIAISPTPLINAINVGEGKNVVTLCLSTMSSIVLVPVGVFTETAALHFEVELGCKIGMFLLALAMMFPLQY